MKHEPTVLGCGVNERAQCVHYHSDRDVVAIRFKCCDKFYACILCHQEVADHPAAVWPKSERNNQAVLCGSCGSTLSITDYLNCGNFCPRCGTAFNSGCANHYHLYFEL